jgi:hypothetical protein
MKKKQLIINFKTKPLVLDLKNPLEKELLKIDVFPNKEPKKRRK